MKTRGVMLEPRTYRTLVAPPAATLEDASRFKSDGAITTATWVRLPSGFWVLDFDPISYVTIPAAHTQLDFTSEDFSMIFRVNTDSVAASEVLWEKGLHNIEGVLFWISIGGGLEIFTSQGAANQMTNTAFALIAINTWYTIGLSRNGASIRLYIDGVDVTNVAVAHIDPVTTVRTAKIGIRDNLAGNPFDGKIGFFRIYNYELSPAEHWSWHQRLRLNT